MIPKFPQNVEAEQEVLGAILLNNDTYGAVSHIVGPEHFAEPLHARMFAEVGRRIASGARVTAVTLKDAFPNADLADGVTIHAYLARLASCATTIIHAPDHAALVRDLAQMREIITLGHNLQRAADNLTAPDEALRQAFEQFDTIRLNAAGGATGRSDIASLIAAGREERARGGDSSTVVSTGLLDLDRDLGGGWRTGRLYVIAGRPGMGKTVFLLSSARRVARRGIGVSIFSLEIDGAEIRARLTSDELSRSHSPVPYRDIVSGQIDDARAWTNIEAAEERLKDAPIRIDDSGGVTMADIEARVRIDYQRLQKRGIRLGVVYIDYLGLVRASNRYRGNKVEEMGEIALHAKTMAKRLDVAVVLMSQLNRGVESREDKRPTMADIRASGEIEEHADCVGLLYREAYYLEKEIALAPEKIEALDRNKNRLELILGKNRLGPTRTIELFCDVKNSAVDNMRRY